MALTKKDVEKLKDVFANKEDLEKVKNELTDKILTSQDEVLKRLDDLRTDKLMLVSRKPSSF